MLQFREEEKIIRVYRRHLIVVFFEAAPLVLFILIIAGGLFFLIPRLSKEFSTIAPLIIYTLVFFIHLFWIALFAILADFFLDVWILTNQRIIAVEQKGFFSRVVSECALSKIQDTTISVSGFVPTILRYGDLVIRTASEHENFIFKQVGRPGAVSEEIARAAKEAIRVKFGS